MELVYEKKTNKSLDEALQSLKENLKDDNFGILLEFNFKEKLKEKGIEFEDDYVVLEVCNPKEAKILLEKNIHVGYVLPCKMVVRTSDNQTYVGLTNPDQLIKMYDDSDLDDTVSNITKLLKQTIEKSL